MEKTFQKRRRGMTLETDLRTFAKLSDTPYHYFIILCWSSGVNHRIVVNWNLLGVVETNVTKRVNS